MAVPGASTELLKKIAAELSLLQPLLPTYLHVIASSLFPIYIGAHASLSRPSSAAAPVRSSFDSHRGQDDDAYGTDDDDASRMEGFRPEDAIWVPLLAGLTLGSLYLLIKWLEDPSILNLLLTWYFSLFGVFSVGQLFGNTLTLMSSFVFPRAWSDGQTMWRRNSDQMMFAAEREGASSEAPAVKLSPLPGVLSSIALSSSVRRFLWRCCDMMLERWTLHIRAGGETLVKSRFGLNDVVGLVLGAGTVVAYNCLDKPWWLTNALGFGFCYTTLQLMSPATFWTGTMILTGLFLYDIYFVFFTPMMVLVAKSLDVPIKLLIPRPSGPDDDIDVQALAMLGLGDIVLPGMMIGLALRFDLYLYYLRKQTRATRPAAASTEPSDPKGHPEVIKAKYLSTSGGWGERFWTPSAAMSSSSSSSSSFPKPYFHAGIVGYISGMVVTLGVMQVTEHAQPALLYLVPGVLGALWSTALLRGELGLMWAYSERSEDEGEHAGLAPISIFAKEPAKLAASAAMKAEDRSAVSRGSTPAPARDEARPSNAAVRSHGREIFCCTITARATAPACEVSDSVRVEENPENTKST
ncbi:MAG: hypothetical protein M1838_005862 [Thelocarpon superellum]|nr:MAG: hypothetical protein M1838_005862 [Thelocarpon superellum]